MDASADGTQESSRTRRGGPTSILFVDDEQRVLHGLRRMLHPMRGEWDLLFASSGEEALRLLRSHPVDVVISDVRMPGMSGAVLLQRVQEEFPRAVRVVLSGHAEMDSALWTASLAHQFLAKPCEPEQIREVVERTFRLRALLEDEALERLVGSLGALPPAPRTYQALERALADPGVDFEDVARIVEVDPALASKLLQIVNSSLFGVARRLSDVREAARHLGFELVKHLVLSAEIARAFATRRASHVSPELEQEHAARCSVVARALCDEPALCGTAAVAGLLHDVGKLVLACHAGDEHARLVRAAREHGEPLWRLEEEALGASHAEVGAYLLGLWGLPFPVVEAVANHHHPDRVSSSTMDLAGWVHVADALVLGNVARIDLGYLERVQRLDDLEVWRERARALLDAEPG